MTCVRVRADEVGALDDGAPPLDDGVAGGSPAGGARASQAGQHPHAARWALEEFEELGGGRGAGDLDGWAASVTTLKRVRARRRPSPTPSLWLVRAPRTPGVQA